MMRPRHQGHLTDITNCKLTNCSNLTFWRFEIELRGGNDSHERRKWIRASSPTMFEIKDLTTNKGRKIGPSASTNAKENFGHTGGELSLVPFSRINVRCEDALEKVKGRIHNTN